ncbi:MAG: GntR family transcriptional regulator [Zoogloeaceae bacterium]|jgi:DNA-binding GntR family transcriptional regulator|nr:GntR family transcriptional regulator [Zoogloeaceae bacterium]
MTEKTTSPKKRARQAETRQVEGSICDRHLSPALRAFPADKLQLGALTGAKAQVYNQLWRPIAEGRLKPGAKLYEGVIREAVGVSRHIVYGVLQQMASEGCVTLPFNKTPHVAKPSPQEAQDVFETLGVVMVHIVRELSQPARTITAEEHRLLEQHVKMQAEADEANDLITAHLLGIEFLILLASIHGVTLLTEVVARAVVLLTLSLKLYGKFPPPPWHVAFQSNLIDAIFTHRTDEAVREFEERRTGMRNTLRFHGGEHYEHDDLAVLLASSPLHAANPKGNAR